MLRSLPGLLVRLQAVSELVQQLGDQTVADVVPHRRQLLRQPSARSWLSSEAASRDLPRPSAPPKRPDRSPAASFATVRLRPPPGRRVRPDRLSRPTPVLAVHAGSSSARSPSRARPERSHHGRVPSLPSPPTAVSIVPSAPEPGPGTSSAGYRCPCRRLPRRKTSQSVIS